MNIYGITDGKVYYGMVIFFKCSFRSSHGFSMGKYDVDSMLLKHISEKDSNSSSLIPKTIEYTLSHQLGRCLILATDENGHYFFGVYRLIEGNDDKYVNAVFYAPEDPQRILNLYDYFCSNHKSSSLMLLRSVTRVDDTTYVASRLEYTIDNNTIRNLIYNSNYDSSSNAKEYKRYPPNALLAFITTDEYADYQIALEDKFSTNKMFLCEHSDANLEKIANYQLVNKYVYKSSFPIPIPLAIGGSVGLIGVIVAILILLL